MESQELAPLCLDRKTEDFPIGNIPLREHRRDALETSGLADVLQYHPNAWLNANDLEQLAQSHRTTLLDERGEAVAWRGDMPDLRSVMIAAGSFVVKHPWDFLRANELYVGSISGSEIEGEVHPAAHIEGFVRIGKGSKILPGVFIEGNVVIGEGCKIGPNCYLRGSTSVGDRCHIGQSVEIKNCVILSGTNVGHLSYVGDSVLGEKVNFGAGTTVSNLRHDGKNHRSMSGGSLVDTGRRKFGTIVGDGVHTGINTSVYPGRKFWPGTSTLPGAVVKHDVM